MKKYYLSPSAVLLTSACHPHQSSAHVEICCLKRPRGRAAKAQPRSTASWSGPSGQSSRPAGGRVPARGDPGSAARPPPQAAWGSLRATRVGPGRRAGRSQSDTNCLQMLMLTKRKESQAVPRHPFSMGRAMHPYETWHS